MLGNKRLKNEDWRSQPIFTLHSSIFSTTAVSHWLSTAVSPRILHLFAQVCNLVDGKRRVISLVTPEIGEGPFSLAVDLADGRFPDFIQADSPVHIHDESVLQVGSLLIDTNTAKIWNARPLWETVPSAAIKTSLPLFQSNLAPASPDSLANGRSEQVETAVRTLLHGLKTDNLAACRESTRSLAGLGVGLTPAGDDFLLGVIYSLWLAHARRKTAQTQKIIETIAAEAAPRTTTLSAAWLTAAARGEAGRPWHTLITALRDGKNISPAIDHILATGHTSGADALAGFIAASNARHGVKRF
jgi:hypothetical protein